MGESVYLAGSETVGNAASTIHAAAQRMESAASQMFGAVQAMERVLDDHARRIEAAVAEQQAERPSLLDLFALHILNANVSRRGGGDAGNDIYQAYELAELALKVREELNAC